MAHEVETMAYANEVPWHGLGFNINPDASIEEWIRAAGLDWEVKKAPVVFNNGSMHVYKDRFVLYRDKDNAPMNVVAGRYKPVQPKELLEFYRDLLDIYGMKIETAGSLRNGKRVWALAKTGDVHKVLGRDRVDGYLLLATSYDSTFSTLAQFTSVRVVCNNTLQLSLRDKLARVTVPHLREFKPEEVKDQLGIGREAWEAFKTATDVLAKAKVDDTLAKEFIFKLFAVDPKQPVEDMEPAQLVEHKHASNVIDLFRTPSPSTALAGSTAWGLVNAVTGYVDHGKRARGADGRLNSAWFGDGAGLKQRAWDRALELVAA